MRIAKYIAIAIVALTLPSSASGTGVSTVGTDLSIAHAYWHDARPDLSTACPSVQVVTRPMEPGFNGATMLPGGAIWAETVDGSCLIAVSPEMAATMNTASYEQQMSCDAMVHEYGHILGLPDVATPGIMDGEWQERLVPACQQLVVVEPEVAPAVHHRKRHQRL